MVNKYDNFINNFFLVLWLEFDSWFILGERVLILSYEWFECWVVLFNEMICIYYVDLKFYKN